jgi:FkbM family methyltransferase
LFLHDGSESRTLPFAGGSKEAHAQMSYSQNSEELHIGRIVGDKPGCFLDIGAYNPKLFSNTRALYERGWSGVMVESSPGPFMDLFIEYGRCEQIQLVCAAVSGKHELVRFHHSEAGVGTSSESHYQKWRDKAQFDGKFFASTVTPEDLMLQFGNAFDFINIDVEGGSADLFLAMIMLRPIKIRPKCWCVEHDGRQEQLTQQAIMQGYCLEHMNGENVIFARQT